MCRQLGVVVAASVAAVYAGLWSGAVDRWLDNAQPDVNAPFATRGNFAAVSRAHRKGVRAAAVLPQDAGAGDDVVGTGAVPAALRGGVYVRTGPNWAGGSTVPPKGYHWFDGDGMVHAVHLGNSEDDDAGDDDDGGDQTTDVATYANDWMQTPRLRQDVAQGFPSSTVRLGGLVGGWGLIRVLVMTAKRWLGLAAGTGSEFDQTTANTNIVAHAGKLLALQEASMPFVLSPGALAGAGLKGDGAVSDLGGRWRTSLSAHPHRDGRTGEMVLFGYGRDARDSLHFGVMDARGKVTHGPIVVPTGEAPSMQHDFAITENYALFMDLPLRFDPKGMVRNRQHAYAFNASAPSRFGIIPRNATDGRSARWFEESPACFVFHVANAWEEGDEVVLVAVRLPSFDLSGFNLNGQGHFGNMHEWRFNLRTGTTTERQLDSTPVEFPVVDPTRFGYKTKVAFAATMDRQVADAPVFDGVARFDLETGRMEGRLHLQPWEHCGEFSFVPSNSEDAGAAEGEGHLVGYTYNADTKTSYLVIADATPTETTKVLPIVTRIRLPARVPWGFHGSWIPAEQLTASM